MKQFFRSVQQRLVALLCAGSLLFISYAEAQPPEVQKANGVTFVSGGVGDDAMAALTAIESEYDLKLFLVGQSGVYLSDIQITVIDAQGKGLILTTSEGPVLLANLPTGTYVISAQKNDHRIEQSISVIRGKLRTVYFRFPGE